MISCHPSEPVINKRGLPDTGPGNDGNHVDILVCPCMIQKSNILFSTKEIASSYGQSGHGNLLWCKSCWPLASSDTGSRRGKFLQALTSDSTPPVDSIRQRRHRLQKFGWVVKSPRRIFFKESL